MSICSDTNSYDSVEYNPCIRKGKHKPKHKKQKNYQAKIQKINLIRPKRHKLVDNCDTIYNSKELFNELVSILKRGKVLEWNDDYDLLYTQVFKLKDDKEFEDNYNNIQRQLEEIRQEELEDMYEEAEMRYYRYRYRRWWF